MTRGTDRNAAARLSAWSAGHALKEGTERQFVPPDPEGAQRAGGGGSLKAGEPVWVQSGKSRILHLDRPVTRVSLGNPALAGIVVLGPRTIQINAKELKKEEEAANAGMSVFTGRMATISNRPLTPEPRMAETTLIVWEGDHYDPHSLIIADFLDRQVMLEVTVAVLDRTAMEDHGIDFRKMGNSFVSAYFLGGGAGARPPGLTNTVPPQIAQPLLPLTLGDQVPNYVFQLPQEDITAFVKLLQTEGLATILAQPKLLAMSGQSAVFQVGGEIPIRIVTGLTADVEFKPFGTLVNFVPRVSDDGDIMLTVTPEVSQPDFTNKVEDIPSFLTRRASTSTRLRNGETFVIGGLLQTSRREQVRGVPYLMNIPAVGYVFRDTSYIDDVTELMVIVTPHLVNPIAPGEEIALPTDRGPLTHEDTDTQPNPAEMTRPRIPGVLVH